MIKPLDEVTEMGRRYAATKDPDLQLELCQCFHPYLMKYLVMICRGHVPILGIGNKAHQVNPDVAPFIRYFVPKGEPINRATLSKAVRHFHLAFRDMEIHEVYDILMEQFISALNGYDPDYKAKVKVVVETIQHELRKQKQFPITDVNRYLEFDCARHIRMLVRSGFLEVVPGKWPAQPEFKRLETWPPPDEFFEGSPIGVAYYVQRWFRFGLLEWIHVAHFSNC